MEKDWGNHLKIWCFSSSPSSSPPLRSKQFSIFLPACSIIPGEDATQASVSPWNGKKCQALGTHGMYRQRIQVFWAWTHPDLPRLNNAHPVVDFGWMPGNNPLKWVEMQEKIDQLRTKIFVLVLFLVLQLLRCDPASKR